LGAKKALQSSKGQALNLSAILKEYPQHEAARQRADALLTPGVRRWQRNDHPLHEGHRHLGVASTDAGADPDVVVGSAGDILTKEALAAVAILREKLPDLKIRFVNVVDLYRLQPDTEHPHGLSDRDFDSLFTKDKPVIFDFHGYPSLIHKFTSQDKSRSDPRERLQRKGQHQYAVGACNPQSG
jgi:hypothetical protein